jgi:hypothetical protein
MRSELGLSQPFPPMRDLRMQWSRAFNIVCRLILRATSHTRLRTHDHYTSSTLVDGKSGAGPSSLHITLEEPTEYVNARWMRSLHGVLHGIEWIMFQGQLEYFQPLIYYNLSYVTTHTHRNSLK